MKDKEIALREIKSLIKAELSDIDALQEEMKDYLRENNKAYRRAKGSVLQDFYNACERIFEYIARNINSKIEESPRWHKKLLNQMRLKLEGLRPPVISTKLAAELEEYLSFRHLYRNIYGFELESERIDKLSEKFDSVCENFKKEINLFLSNLK